ncbi:HAD-IIB family hydrolase [Patescibacteria group bacterium]|nr:HAD-IIB family hydrolase [Patescibacteria group bacterium]
MIDEPLSPDSLSDASLLDVIMFDLDKTLASSKQAITPSMAALLSQLSLHTLFTVISGGKREQLEQQVVNQLSADAETRNVYLQPTSGAALFTFENGLWTAVYEESLTAAEATHIKEVLEQVCTETKLVDLSSPSHGERIEFRGASVAMSVLGQQAPIDEKEAWDSDNSKKKTLQTAAQELLPEYDVKTGGATTIDVTKKGINKAYGVRKLSEYLQVPIRSMLYIGDALYPGGNDEVVKATGITTHEVKNPDDTEMFIKGLLAKVR